MFIFCVLSLTGMTQNRFLSYFSAAFFIWNMFNERIYPHLSMIFCLIIICLNIYYLRVFSHIGKNNQELTEAFVNNWKRVGYDSAAVKGAQTNLNNIAKYIELCKRKHKEYPSKIPQYNTSVDCFFVNLDFSYRKKVFNGVSGTPFYYEIIDKNKYYLGGVGKDGIIKTEDDLVPEINILEEKSTGLLKYKVVALPIMENAKQKPKQKI